jgi:hypothetical protein
MEEEKQGGKRRGEIERRVRKEEGETSNERLREKDTDK